ncbi:hypothetical protein ARTHRO9V_280308 [Arthrobacter sp. 9V]|nr:hypothetical protein ARTHRO9V_280308 [Arthrobacter sp. 9V]
MEGAQGRQYRGPPVVLALAASWPKSRIGPSRAAELVRNATAAAWRWVPPRFYAVAGNRCRL